MNYRTTELLERTFYFGVNILRFLNKLPYSPVYKSAILQLSRSSISIGANYEEAQGAVSKRDFNYRIGVSYKETRESEYWIRILASLYQDDSYKQEFETYKNEANELRRIFAAIKLATNK